MNPTGLKSDLNIINYLGQHRVLSKGDVFHGNFAFGLIHAELAYLTLTDGIK